MLRSLSRNLFVGPLTDCFFDPDVALCLRNQDRSGAEAPIIGHCQPEHCRNSRIGQHHLPTWQERLSQVRADLRTRGVALTAAPPPRPPASLPQGSHRLGPFAEPQGGSRMKVSDESERLLRAAMQPILAGTPIRSSRSFTVTALAVEAGVSRRTAGRATAVLRDFREAGERQANGPSSDNGERAPAAGQLTCGENWPTAAPRPAGSASTLGHWPDGWRC